MSHFLKSATAAELADLDQRLGEPPASFLTDAPMDDPTGSPAPVDGEILAARCTAENGIFSLPMLELLVGAGSLQPEDIPLLRFVKLSQSTIISTDVLRWNSSLREFVEITEDGRIRRLNRVVDFLTRGHDEDGWMNVSTHPDVLAGGSAPESSYRLQRVCRVFDTVLAVIPDAPMAGSTGGSAPVSGVGWRAVDVNGRWKLVDRHTGSLTEPVFAQIIDATRAADAGILGEDGRYCWLDRSDPFEPCS